MRGRNRQRKKGSCVSCGVSAKAAGIRNERHLNRVQAEQIDRAYVPVEILLCDRCVSASTGPHARWRDEWRPTHDASAATAPVASRRFKNVNDDSLKQLIKFSRKPAEVEAAQRELKRRRDGLSELW